MYAPAHPPTPPRRVPGRGWIVSMRVLFTVLTVGSVGLLLWTPLLRLAIVRRRATDWWLTGAGFVFVCVLLPILGDGGEEPTGIDNVLIPLLLLAMAGSIAYYLVGDVRHYDRLTKERAMPGPPPGYAYAQTVPTLPSPAPAPAPAPVQPPYPHPQFHPRPQPQQQPLPLPLPQPQQPPPPQPLSQQQTQPSRPTRPSHPRPQRIDQVRAELDELSDYLRKEEGR